MDASFVGATLPQEVIQTGRQLARDLPEPDRGVVARNSYRYVSSHLEVAWRLSDRHRRRHRRSRHMHRRRRNCARRLRRCGTLTSTAEVADS